MVAWTQYDYDKIGMRIVEIKIEGSLVCAHFSGMRNYRASKQICASLINSEDILRRVIIDIIQ